MKNRKSVCLKTLLACTCAQSVLFTGFLPVMAAQSETIINDDNAAITYSAGNANNGGWGSSAGTTKESSEHWSNTADASFSFNFTGNGIELWGIKAPNHRKMSIKIDDMEPVEFDCYASSRTSASALLFSSVDENIELEDKEHTALVTVLDSANENANTSGTMGVSFNYAKIYSESEAETPAENPGFSIIENSVVTEGSEPFKFKYIGSWQQESGYPNLFHNGDDAYSNNAGDSWQMVFTGTQIEIYASKNPAHGTYTIYIDDEAKGTVNSGDVSSTTHQQMIFASEVLENKEHTLKVVMEDNDVNAGKAIQVDYVKIMHEALTASSIELDKTTAVIGPSGSITLNVSITPWLATDSIVWSSSDPDVTVENGVVTAGDMTEKKEVVITAASAADPEIKAQCLVTVDPARALLSAFVGDEMRLDLAEDAENLSAGTKTDYSATAWKNDTVCSKIVVTSQSRALNNVIVTPSAFVTEDGTVLSADAISAAWLEEVNANIGRGNASAPVKAIPDRIGSSDKTNIEANDAAFAWVTIHVPADAVPGIYHGTLNVTADEMDQPMSFDYTLEVVDMLLEEPTMDLQLWQHPYSVANYYLGLGSTPSDGISNDLDEDFYFTEAHFNLMRDSYEDYAKTGGHDAVANIVNEAWGHQSYYNDPSMVTWTKKSDGTWSFDYSDYDAWISFMIDTGVINPEKGIGKIKCYSIVPWSNRVKYFDEASNAWADGTFEPGTDNFNDAWSAFLTDFMAHSKEKGWFDITYISMDERNISQLRPAVELIKSVKDAQGDAFKVSSCMNADYTSPTYYEFLDQVEDISVNLGSADQSRMKALTDHRKPLGLNTTIYTCTGDYPGNFAISDPQDNYWSVLYALSCGADGYLKWAFDNYVYDMYGNITYRYWEPGDGWFIYPESREGYSRGDEVSFRSTPRYELLKKGLRDASKAKILLDHPGVSDETKEELSAAIDAMSRPAKGTSYGSATYASAASRDSVTDMIEAVMDKVRKAEKEAADYIAPEEPSVDKTALADAVKNAEAIELDDYKDGQTKDDFVKALNEAQKVLLASAVLEEKTVEDALAALQSAMENLEKKDEPSAGVDKSALEESVETAEDIQKTDLNGVLKSRIEAFVDALKNAQDVLKNDHASQAEVSQAKTALDQAMDQLIPVDKTALKEKADEAAAIDLDEYEDGQAKDNFAAALAQAQTVLLPETVLEDDTITDALNALQTAMNQLVKKADDPAKTVDRSVLEEAVSNASAKKEAGLDGILKSSIDAFEAALENAQSVLTDEKATQKEIDQAAAWLNKAAEKLAAEDKSDLEKAIKKAQLIQLDKYEDNDAKEAFKQALEKAMDLARPEAVLLDGALSDAVNKLEETASKLTEKSETPVRVDKSLLEEALKKHDALDLSRYEDGALKDAFVALIAHGKDLLGSDAADQKQIDQAIADLENARNALAVKAPADENDPGENKPGDADPSVPDNSGKNDSDQNGSDKNDSSKNDSDRNSGSSSSTGTKPGSSLNGSKKPATGLSVAEILTGALAGLAGVLFARRKRNR